VQQVSLATGMLAPSVAMTSVLNPLVGILVGTLLLDERLADPTWHKVVAYIGLGLALAAAVSITRATEGAPQSADAVDVDSSSRATPAT
jgi:drug/metabolite transporter (DMT)-like permease